MSNFMYILLILFNLNLLLLTFNELLVKFITIFNYKNAVNFTNNFFFFYIILYFFYRNKNVSKILNKAIAL